jgi:hypothetical protein
MAIGITISLPRYFATSLFRYLAISPFRYLATYNQAFQYLNYCIFAGQFVRPLVAA